MKAIDGTECGWNALDKLFDIIDKEHDSKIIIVLQHDNDLYKQLFNFNIDNLDDIERMNNFVIHYALEDCPNTLREAYFKDYNNIKQALTTKSKKEQALDIVVKKNVNVGWLKALFKEHCDTYDCYCYYVAYTEQVKLTEEEFNLLKEVVGE